MPDESENVNENEVTQDAEAAETEAVDPEAGAEVVDEPATDEAPEAPEAEPMAAEVEPAVETAEPESEPEPATEPAADAEEVVPAAAAGEPAGGEVAPARRKKKRLPRSLRQQRTKTKREKPAERKPIVRLPKPEHPRGRRQERQGRVVSASADKTIVVRVDVAKVHPRYKKVVKRSTRFHAHDEENQAKVGDVVRIVETRPLSRMKRWRLHEIVEAAK